MNLFDLFIKIKVDDQASDKIQGLSSKLGSGLKAAAGVGVAAVGAAATGIAALTKNAVANYAEYEQLVGGIEVLFKDSSDEVMRYAENAYRTSGMSANKYMETATSFAASLVSSLGGDTAKAAEMADLAITDMSDNVNRMGGDIALIENAYKGFARGSFVMLDNLKLGYAGSQAEMERLLADAEAISGIHYDISSYSDIVQAIHVIQDEMGIAGATAEEASSTISGSLAAMKAAWQNLVVGVADDEANMEVLMDNFVESVTTAGENILPRIETALTGAAKLVEGLTPVIVEQIPAIIADFLPQLVQSGGNIILSLVRGLADNSDKIVDGAINTGTAFIETVGKMMPEIIATGILLLGNLAVGIIEAIPDLVEKVPQIIKSIVGAFKDAAPEIKEIGSDIVRGIWRGIEALGDWLGDKVSNFFGGIVDGVKGLLGIHSPSRVFAEIGGFMAEGLGEGWDKEYGGIKRNIAKDMDFGTATVDFQNSAMAHNSASTAAAMARGFATANDNMTIVVQSVLDGSVIGETAYKFSKNRQRMLGVT